MLPNTINSPTSADLNRKSILEMAIYVYEVALALSGNIDFADNFMREYMTRAEAAASRADSDAAVIGEKFDEAIASAESAASDARAARTSAINASTDASTAASGAYLATSSASAAEDSASAAEASASAAEASASAAEASASAAAVAANNATNGANAAASAANASAASANAAAASAAEIAAQTVVKIGTPNSIELRQSTITIPANSPLTVVPMAVVTGGELAYYVGSPIVIPASKVNTGRYYYYFNFGEESAKISINITQSGSTRTITLSARDVASNIHINADVYRGGSYT